MQDTELSLEVERGELKVLPGIQIDVTVSVNICLIISYLDSEEFLLLEDFERFVEQGQASTSTLSQHNPTGTTDPGPASHITPTDEVEGYLEQLKNGKVRT